MREYQKQKEKLALTELECIIEWTKKTILARQAKARQLNDELGDIHLYLQALEEDKKIIMDGISEQNAWMKPENQRQTLKLLEINSK